METISTLQDLWFLFLTAPVVIKVALAVITFVVCMFMIMLLSAAISFFLERIRQGTYEKLKEKHRTFILDCLESQNLQTPTEIQLAFGIHCGKLNNKTYYSLIPTLQEIIEEKPEIQRSINYKPLIEALGIDNHLESKLNFSSIANKLKIFHQLSRFKVLIADSKILPYTFSKNRFVRKGARNAYIGVSNNNPFKFFDQDDNQINYWDQIILMEQLELHHKNNLPNFSNWLKYSKNHSQTIFLIKAASYFKQYGSVNTLIHLLDSEDHEIRKESIVALGQMQVKKVEDKLIELYPSQPNKCKDAIIEALFLINSKNATQFMREAFENSPNYDSKKLIAEAIFYYESDGHPVFNEMLNTADSFNKSILNHVKNPLNNITLKAPSDSNIVVLEAREDGTVVQKQIYN